MRNFTLKMKTINSVFPLGMDSREIATSPKNDILSHVFAERRKDVELMQSAFALLSNKLVWINWHLQDGYSKLSNMLYDKFNDRQTNYNPKDIVLQIEELIDLHNQIINELDSSIVNEKNYLIQKGIPWSLSFMAKSHFHFQKYLIERKGAFI